MRTLILGSTGGIGAALAGAVPPADLTALSRTTLPAFDLTDEASIAAAAAALQAPYGRIVVATGALTIDGQGPEKCLADLDPAALARAFAINTIGPALILKHFAALLPRQGRCVFAVLSARVGSIGDNRLGGWYAYRASKAALNQVMRTAAVEIARRRPEAIVLALHPGTVRTSLSAPFTETADAPSLAAERLFAVMDSARETGAFLDQHGVAIQF